MNIFKHLALLSIILLSCLLVTFDARADEIWDRSSIELTGQCLTDGSVEFTVSNTGQDMSGPSAWREYEDTILASAGIFQLIAGGTQSWIFGPRPNVEIHFEADQRPGHPGNSNPSLTLICKPTAITLNRFMAIVNDVDGWIGLVLIAFIILVLAFYIAIGKTSARSNNDLNHM